MPTRQRDGRLLSLLCLLLALWGAARIAHGATLPPADPAAALLAQQIEAEIARHCDFTRAFAADPLFRHHELWYRPWQDNSIVLLMDRTLADVDEILLSQLVDLDGQLVAVNAHDGAGLPLPSSALYLDDFRDRPWFLTLAAAGARAQPRIDGPAMDPDLQRVYPQDEPCLRISVPVCVGSRLVAVLSHCLRFKPVATRIAEAAAAPGAEPGAAVALVDREGQVLAGGEPVLGSLDFDMAEYPIAIAGEPRWTLRAWTPHRSGLQRGWLTLLAALPSRAEMAPWPGYVLRVSALLALSLLGLGLLKRRLTVTRPQLPATRLPRLPALPTLPRLVRDKRSRRRERLPRRPLVIVRALRRLRTAPPRLLPSRPMAVPRGPLTAAEKAYELLATLLGALQGTLHALADGSEALAERRRDPLFGRPSGATLQALRRASGLTELLRSLEQQTQVCRADAALHPAIGQGMDVFARLGREIGAMLGPLAETEQRLARLPRSGQRTAADAQHFRALTESLQRTVALMTALQAGLGRLPQRMLCGTDQPRPGELANWQAGVADLQDLLLTLARELGATRKLLELLPSATGSGLIVRDLSGESALGDFAREERGEREERVHPQPSRPSRGTPARPSTHPAGSAAAPALAPFAAGQAIAAGPRFELLTPERKTPPPAAPAPRFEVIGGGRKG